MKVLFVLPNVQVGGVERVRLALIEHFVANGIDCCLALRRCSGELIERAKSLAPVEELAPRGIYQFVPSLARLIKRERPTHVVTAFSDVAVLTWIAMRLVRTRAKWMHSVDNTHSMVGSRRGVWGRARYRLENRMAVFVYRRADVVVAVSNGIRQEILNSYHIDPSRVTRIYNPVVPDEQLCEERLDLSPRGGTCRLIAVGRLVRQKGFDVLIRAMAFVPGGWQLDIWGEGPDRPQLERLISDSRLGSVIHLRGYTSDQFAALRQADVFVLPSRHEGLGNALIEALACQCQVVATDCPQGPREILQDGKLGLLVPPEDPAALASAIRVSMERGCYVNHCDLLQRARLFSVRSASEKWLRLMESA